MNEFEKNTEMEEVITPEEEDIINVDDVNDVEFVNVETDDSSSGIGLAIGIGVVVLGAVTAGSYWLFTTGKDLLKARLAERKVAKLNKMLSGYENYHYELGRETIGKKTEFFPMKVWDNECESDCEVINPEYED